MTCETCLRFENDHEHNEPDPECQDCMKYIIHKQKASISRQHYDADKKKDTQPWTEVYVSVVFHETFAPLGEQKKKKSKTDKSRTLA